LTVLACALTALSAQAGQKKADKGDDASLPVVATNVKPSKKLSNPAKQPAPSTAKKKKGCSDTDPQVDLQLLIVSSDGSEADLPAIQQTLDYMGTPYTLWRIDQHPGGLTADVLASGCHGFYQGVILTNNALPLTFDEWTALLNYETSFGVRRVCWYTIPNADYGYADWTDVINTSDAPLPAHLTPEGAAVFSYLKPTATIPIKNVFAFRAQPLDSTGTPLLKDDQGDALVLQENFPDGRQTLAFAFDSNAVQTHILALGYGAINWVTKGLFIGQHRISTDIQIDDVFLPNALWGGGIYRITGDDINALQGWQDLKRQDPLLPGLTIEMAFNGVGTTAGYASPDTLTKTIKKLPKGVFSFMSHTYTHQDENVSNYETALSELTQNLDVADHLTLKKFSKTSMVPPAYTGLTNPAFMQAAYDAGLRNLAADASDPTYLYLPANTGTYSPLQPEIFLTPRHPGGLSVSASTPDQCIGFYNEVSGTNLTYSQFLDQISDLMVQFLLRGDWDPWMYHQSNLRAYDGTHSLLSDLLDATFAKYEALFNLPIEDLSQEDAGNRMLEKMGWTSAGVTATKGPGNKLTLTAAQDTVVRITGITKGDDFEVYGDQTIDKVKLKAGKTVTINLQ
jgi:hypothetical protein